MELILLGSSGSPTRSWDVGSVGCSYISLRILVLIGETESYSTCTNFASEFPDYASASSESSDSVSELKSKVCSECMDSSFTTGGSTKASACGSCGACEGLSSNWTLRSIKS